jgi:hypothetical protein
VSERAARPSPDFGAQVAEAQRQLAQSITRAGLTRDAYRHVLEAHAAALAVLPAFLAEIEARRQPWTKDERRDAALAFVARLDQCIARRMVQFNRWAIVGIAVAVPALCGASLLGGWWWGCHSETVYVQRTVDALPAAAIRYGAVGAPQWLTLMTNNDITAAHRDCRAVAGGGEACSYDLWSRLPQVPTR